VCVCVCVCGRSQFRLSPVQIFTAIRTKSFCTAYIRAVGIECDSVRMAVKSLYSDFSEFLPMR
jgi:hypothetical protein